MDPGVEQHLQLSAFKASFILGKFDVTEFVGGVSEKLIAQSKAEAGPFDPQPFIRTFEAAVDKLIAVRKEVQAKTEQMEKSVRVSEREYSKKMNELNRGFEAVGSSFSGMESRMNEVGSTAIRIGEELESVHIERQRAKAAYDIIDFYNQFSKGDTARLDTMRKEGRQGRRQVAILLRRLSTVAKEVDLPSAEKTRENIEKYCEKFEKEMLNLFDRCYRRGDPKMMHNCAQTLLEFNGGNSCIQVYVNQHDFFINNVRETKPDEDKHLWEQIPDPDASPPKTEKGLADLFVEIRATVETEAQIVKAVFPSPPMVMQVFLQRVFAQSIQQHVEQLLHKASTISDLVYLRVLQLVHGQATSLVEDLKAYELSIRVPYGASGGGSAAGGGGTSATMTTMLETAMEELFVPYTEGQRYLERESRSLGTLYTSLLVNFTRYHAKSQKGKASVFDRVVNQLSAAASTTSTGGVQTTSSQAATAILRLGGFSSDKNAEQSGEEPIREEDGQLSVELAEKMLRWHAEAIGRCVELSATNDVAKNTFSLLRVLAEAIGTAYLEEALETELSRLETSDTKSEPSMHALSVLKHVDLVCHLWQQYVNSTLLPLATSSVTVRREMAATNNQTVSRIEGNANQLMHRLIDAVITWLTTQLTKQKRNDFKPKNDDLSFARVNTEPCEACCDMLEKVRDSAKASLSGKNLEVFLTEVGVTFHSLLLEHLRKFPVSATGGLMLAKDIKMYQDTIASFGIPPLTERFEFIRQLGNVFLVRPEILKSYITENYLGRIDPTLLKPYLALRSDWGQFEKGFDDGEPEEGSIAETKGLKDRFGRLSVMMKDLEGLRPESFKFGDSITLGMPTLPSGLTAGFSLGNARPF
ncbi:Exocyst complex component 5 [Marasmius crinis-equi]|uniref:Exocyst complex component 5 n=1 Tax=Marasmius crinis-equi TaxID=585013 RepID=A0ABR3F5T6_9AGAR